MSTWTLAGIVMTVICLLALWAANGVRYYRSKGHKFPGDRD